MASEKVIVRASNPGQFEADNEPPWTRDGNSDTLFHMGKYRSWFFFSIINFKIKLYLYV